MESLFESGRLCESRASVRSSTTCDHEAEVGALLPDPGSYFQANLYTMSNEANAPKCAFHSEMSLY